MEVVPKNWAHVLDSQLSVAWLQCVVSNVGSTLLSVLVRKASVNFFVVTLASIASHCTLKFHC